MNTRRLKYKAISFLLALIFISTNTAYSSQDTLRIPLNVTNGRLQAAIKTISEAPEPAVNGDHLKGPARIDEIKELLSAIDKESKEPGSGNLPQIIIISDYHGEIDLFLRYIADAVSQKTGKKIKLDHKMFPQQSIKEQLEAQDVDIAKAGLEFYLLGDLLDRGSYGIKCFRAAEELINLGIAKYVTGNHDLWAFLNVMGYHLPIYEGYNFYDHFESEDLVREHMDEHKRDIAWWTGKLAEYNAAQYALQAGVLDGIRDVKSIRAELKDIYLQIKDQLTPSEKELWQDLVGFYFDSTDVYTGFNGVGMMSVQWWQERLARVHKFVQETKSQTESSSQLAIWEKLHVYTEAATKVVTQRLIHATKINGEWWWQVFNDINHQNYESVEWWGKDWSSHSGWGVSVIEELNRMEPTSNWTQSNYIKNQHLKDLALFYRKQFTLYRKDQYGNYYTHGWLPVNMDTGQISFTYKGITYEGLNIWKGLEAIQNDVRDLTKPLPEIHEALSLVNSWYADKTTKIKPENVAGYVNKVGLEKIYTNIGVRTWFTCHNPLNKLHSKGVGFKVQQGEYLHFSVDKGMSWKKFEDAGGYVLVSANGIVLRGYDGPSFERIINSPHTMVIKKGEGMDEGYMVTKNWANEPLAKEAFLKAAKAQLMEELNALKPFMINRDAETAL